MRATILTAVALLLLPLAGHATAAPGPSPADLAFLQSLAEPEAPAAPAPEIGTPAPTPRTCTATVDCGDGNTVSCTGNSICQVTSPGVKCDGVETRCPNYCTIGMSCECCTGTRTASCFSRKGDCQRVDNVIYCDGVPHPCICPFCH